MKRLSWLALAQILLFVACQPRVFSVTILDGDQVISISTVKTIPVDILSAARVTLGPKDRLYYLSMSTPLDVALPKAKSYTLTIRRAVAMTVNMQNGQKNLQTSALTVGKALAEAGYTLYVADRFDPSIETIIRGPLTFNYSPSRVYTVNVDGQSVLIRSAAITIGQALTEAGIPLQGLDYSLPAESAPLPKDGQIRIVRVVETVMLTQKSIPYNTLSEFSDDLELDQQAIAHPGAPGLAVARVRVRNEDGVEVSRQNESESVVLAPQDRVVSYGTHVVMHTTTVDGVTITYWRALEFYATSYHPAETGSDRTASGLPVAKGRVGIDRHYIPFYTQMYVSGYGYAVAADTGGYSGRWIDLGYRDDEYVPWHQWVTVYFIWPPPAVIPYTIPPPYIPGVVIPSPP